MKDFFKDGVAYTGAGAHRGTPTREPEDLIMGNESAFPITVSGWASLDSIERTGQDRLAYVTRMIANERALHKATRARHRQLSISVVVIVALLGLAVALQFALL